MTYKIEIYLNNGGTPGMNGDDLTSIGEKIGTCVIPTHPRLLIVETNEDTSEEKNYLVSYGFHKQPGKSLANPVKNDTSWCCFLPNPITVFSDQARLDLFIKEYESQFQEDNFSYRTHNCSNAAMFTLEYFLGKNYFIEALKAASVVSNIACCVGHFAAPGAGTLGILFFTLSFSCSFINIAWPSLPCVTVPRDVGMRFFLEKCCGRFSHLSNEKDPLIAPTNLSMEK